MKRPNPEFNAGEAQAKKRILAFIRRAETARWVVGTSEVADFIKGMAKRSAKHPGGAGRK